MFPDRFIGIAPFRLAMSAILPACEGSRRLQFFEAAPHLVRTHEAEPTGSAKLHHKRHTGAARVMLWTVESALRKIADIAFLQRLARRDIGGAGDAKADLVEIVPVMRALIFAAIAGQHQAEIVGVAIVAAKEVFERQAAFAVPFFFLGPGEIRRVNDLHNAPPKLRAGGPGAPTCQ